MENKEIFSGKTVEEAVETGLSELGLARDEVEIEVLDQGKKKLFGSGPAQVKLVRKRKLTDGERAVEFLEGLLERMDKSVSVSLAEEDERIVILLSSETEKEMIGRRGEFIDSLQVLAGAVANTGRREYKRVVVDCGNYREEREETLRRLALKLAAKAVRLGKRVRLEPMNPYERRIIHSALADNPEVTSKSEGKEPMRFVVILPKNMRTAGKKDRASGDRRQDGKGGYRKDRGAGRDSRYGGERNKPYPKRELPKEDTPQSSGTSLKRESSSGYRKGSFSGFFGTYLGNSKEESETAEEKTEE